MRRVAALAGALLLSGCGRSPQPQASTPPPAVRPSILLVTLDTTRADAMGPDAKGVETPAFNALAARGRFFRQAYTTVPETLPAHSSLLTGLHPAGHGVRENGRVLAAQHPVLAERLREAGYRTGAFVSAFVLARRFGLARGFSVYDDDLPQGGLERTARETTDAALAHLDRPHTGPDFIWVHYFEPHAPYAPPDPYRSRYPAQPYLGEVAAMDAELGRLVSTFERQVRGPLAIVIVSDHGEGLGDHGESQHGNLLYQSTMHVPLLVMGPGVAPGPSDVAVSTRRVFHTILDWAGLETAHSLRGTGQEVVLGEAMKPFLSYGWQPQVMAIEGRLKAISAGRLEVYDVVDDPGETRDLEPGSGVTRTIRTALLDYPAPSKEQVRRPDSLSPEERGQLASLGYVSAGAAPVVRQDAPRPVDMTRLFDTLERASALFVAERYAEAVPPFERILAADPHNLDATLRLATAFSALGREARAQAAFVRAEQIAPGSADVRTYRALHYARGKAWARAVPLLEGIVAEDPDRLPALEALAVLRQREGRLGEAVALRQRIYALRRPTRGELVQLGEQAMAAQQTIPAQEAFEKARAQDPRAFKHDLELGVLYLAQNRYAEARDALDRVSPAHRAYPMALFKRAQVSVLLHEPDRAARIERARAGADPTTRALIANERLFAQN